MTERGVAIAATGLGKRYLKYDDEAMLATKRARLRSRTRKSSHWALRGIGFELEQGDCLGLIGRNGSGKSTLLRMLAGVTAPSEGRVEVRGRVAPLIAVGVGFHPELTGRENVYVNGSILGVPRRMIDERFDEIVDFAGLEHFIDTPVKFYSSGMFVRLGFGVSMFADPDILLVDEVLAVGDLAFQLQCFDRMKQVRETGTAIVVVSHNLNAIRRLCPRTMLLEDGAMHFLGETAQAISDFHEILGEARDPDADPGEAAQDDDGVTPMALPTAVDLLGPDGARTRHVSTGDTASFVLECRILKPLVDPIVAFRLYSSSGLEVYGDSTLQTTSGRYDAGDVARFVVHVPINLASGSFTAVFNMANVDGVICMRPTTPLSFFVAGRPNVFGAADLHARFESGIVAVEGDQATGS